MQMTKAYKNNEFLMSEEARSIRILSEYLEPRRRLSMHGISRAIVFFGSARTEPITADGTRSYYPLAVELAERMAHWTMERHHPRSYYHLVTGGGPGIMQAVHEGSARVNAALNIGLNISLPFEQNLNSHVNLENAFEFHYFFMRKFWFVNLAHAAVAFPGGFGTLDELFELLTLIQTGKAQRMPVVLFGHEFWDAVVNFRLLAERGLIAEEDLELFRVCDDVDSAFRHLVRGLEPDIALSPD
ncbi:TIGR00730 family Rossman fold protein [Algiphilus sp.]|uniref:LOG family protein n=1 Tax=Algiphilus sp. TaxID=1872431 RepID=UPI003BA9253E